MQNISNIISLARDLRDPEAIHINRAGAPSYSRPLEEQVVQVLTVGTLGDTFYAKGKELAAEAIEVLTRCRYENPQFLARALVHARGVGLMKSAPTLGLVVLSAGNGATKELFLQTFNRVIMTPDDLRAFVAVCRSGIIPGRKGLGGMARLAVQAWLANLTEYHTLKYGSAASKEITLRDILRMSHPRPADKATEERFRWLVKGGAEDLKLCPQITAFEMLKRTNDETEQLRLIREGRLPYEVVVPSLQKTTPSIWSELLVQAPYLNLLRNLVSFHKHEVFKSEESVKLALSKLTSPRAVSRSKVLPFRFYSAYRRCIDEGMDSRISDGLRQALELSFANMPDFGQRSIAIGPDVSGSMKDEISTKGSTRFIDIAGILTGALLKCSKGKVVTLPFDTKVHVNHSLSGRDDVLVTTEKLAKYGGGGTAVGAPIQHLLDGGVKVDVFIGITDQEEWAHGDGYHTRGNFLQLWKEYRQKVNPRAVAYLITIAPHRDAVAHSNEGSVRFIYGWNDQTIKFIASDLEGGASQTQAISAIELVTPVVAKTVEAEEEVEDDNPED
jgi:60 kDa SS-A/Ro ribonucleoprotein